MSHKHTELLGWEEENFSNKNEIFDLHEFKEMFLNTDPLIT